MLASKSSHYFFRHVDERWKNCIRRVTLLFLQSPRTRRAHDLLQRFRYCRDNMWAYCEYLPILQNAKIDHFSLFTVTKIRCVYAGRFKLSTTVDVPFFLFSFFFTTRNNSQLCEHPFKANGGVGHELLLITLKLIFPSYACMLVRGNVIRMLDYHYF